MTDFLLPKFKIPREFIVKERSDGKEWPSIENEIMSDGFISNCVMFGWPEDTASFIHEMIESMRIEEESKKPIIEVVDGKNDNRLELIGKDDTCWACYKNKLRKKFTNVDNIERSCNKILRKLDVVTEDSNIPAKILVAGYVQSGKTANMAGLIAQAVSCDDPFNLFIILSGTIENLREQTSKRLKRDLCDGTTTFDIKDHLDEDGWTSNSIRQSLNYPGRVAYLNVCLKNSKRLKKTVRYLSSIPRDIKQKLKVVVIDDEADLASPNTAKYDDDRKAINKWILYMIRCLDVDGKESIPFKSMSYVAYTATPYACVLSDGRLTSLYPDRMIMLLNPSDTYFGPTRLFGVGENTYGCPSPCIVQSDVDSDMAHYSEQEDSNNIPDSLKDAISWFLCSVSALRFIGKYKDPVSMLIHTSSKVEDHKTLYEAINNYLASDKGSIIARCEKVYARLTSEDYEEVKDRDGVIIRKNFANVTKNNFYDIYPDYPKYGIIDGKRVEFEIDDYPSFTDIRNGIDELLTIGSTPIKTDDEKYDKHAPLTFNRGIHICEDNSKSQSRTNDEKICLRLIYPNEERDQKLPDFATAFIVVGGNTLSRGLTIEGLVCTYFARPVKQGDTLFQMGRWFGYRDKMELFPRMWLSKRSIDGFTETTIIDEQLRSDIAEMSPVWEPRDVAIRILTYPNNSFVKSITSRNKRLAAIAHKGNYGRVPFSTKNLDFNSDIVDKNVEVVKDLIRTMGDNFETIVTRYLWRGIDVDIVLEKFLKRFSDRITRSNDIEDFTKWLSERKESYGAFNVALIGTRSTSPFEFEGPFGISAKPSYWSSKEQEYAKFTFPYGNRDIYIDFDPDNKEHVNLSAEKVKLMKDSGTKGAKALRSNSIMKDVPLFLIYPAVATYQDQGVRQEHFVIAFDILMPDLNDSRDRSYIITELEKLKEEQTDS